jgi:hypothetical protein
MLVDGISRLQVIELAVNAVKNANTLAGLKVFDFPDWPTKTESFPMALVSAPRERKEAIGMPGQLIFNTVVTLVVVARIVDPVNERAGELTDTLAEQIVNALMLDMPLYHSVQQYRAVETHVVVSAEGRQHTGEATVSMELEIYQVYGPDGPPLTNITGTLYPGGTIEPDGIVFSTSSGGA